jgi:cell division transport system permease protein
MGGIGGALVKADAPTCIDAGLAGLLLAFGGLYAGKVLLLDGPLQALSKMMTPIPDGNLWLMLPLPAVAGAATIGIAAWITLRFHIRV